jgi:hypothetical protein
MRVPNYDRSFSVYVVYRCPLANRGTKNYIFEFASEQYAEDLIIIAR